MFSHWCSASSIVRPCCDLSAGHDVRAARKSERSDRRMVETKADLHIPIYGRISHIGTQFPHRASRRNCRRKNVFGRADAEGHELVGAFVIYRTEVGLQRKQIALVQNFAAQAVIAIEMCGRSMELREELISWQCSPRTRQTEPTLEQHVSDQEAKIERMSRLRRFLPPQVADLIVASGSEKQLESHRREITALFCDLRGFPVHRKRRCGRRDGPLRDYHAAIGEIIIKYNGTLERYAGDGVMVVFNDPVPVEDPALQAVLMALEVRDAIGA